MAIPLTRCNLKLLKLKIIKDYLLKKEEFMNNQKHLKPQEDKNEKDKSKVNNLIGSPMIIENLKEIIDENHVIMSSLVPLYVGILSYVKDQIELGCANLIHNKVLSMVGLLQDNGNLIVLVVKVEKEPLHSYAAIGQLDAQIHEIKEVVELPLIHLKLYEDMSITLPKRVIPYGEP
eukprot:Gb_10457 [translate_table: standard]